jgi:hypothetical protein
MESVDEDLLPRMSMLLSPSSIISNPSPPPPVSAKRNTFHDGYKRARKFKFKILLSSKIQLNFFKIGFKKVIEDKKYYDEIIVRVVKLFKRKFLDGLVRTSSVGNPTSSKKIPNNDIMLGLYKRSTPHRFC